jgi:putative ABC transport system permease protein
VNALNTMLRRDLWHLRGQVIAAALVVMCGVASFVSMNSTYQSLRTAQADYYARFRFADVFAGLKRAPDSLESEIEGIHGVAAVETRVVREVTLDVPGLREPATGRLVSIPESPRPMLNDLYLRAGRYVDGASDDEVIASEAFASANALGIGDRIGAILNGRWKQLRIVGIALSPEYVYEVGGGSIVPDNKRFGVLWMNRRAMGPAFNMDGAFNDVALTLARGASTPEVIGQLDRLLARYGGLAAYSRDDQVSNRFLSDEIAQNRVTSTVIPAIFLSVAAFLLHIVLSRLVALQRNEVGLLKAFGYSDAAVGGHYLKLAMAIILGGVCSGIVAGLYLGMKLTQVYTEFYRFPKLAFQGDAKVVLVALLASLAAASIGALASVRKAVSLPPSEAMRPEAPARFQAGLLERSGFQRLVPTTGRIIIRNLERRYWKALLSVLSLALAVGILVVGRFFFDSAHYLMKVQFEVVQRYDARLQFYEPLSRGAVFDIARLAGVLRAEPFRNVPVRLRLAHRSRRTQVTGLYPDSELFGLVDARLKPVALPADGLLLTTKLAELLGARPGDSITVEVLEGRRLMRQTPLAATVDEPVGLNAYMHIDALSRLLGEDHTISGADLMVDPLYASPLYERFKRMPAVSGVGIKAAAWESFRDILERSVTFSSSINVFFACVIAFGMVYNGARISLSERGNELATLRVLGFNEREVAVVLLGEQAVLTLVAIPLGCGLGYAISALLVHYLNAELYRIPLVVETSTFAVAAAVVIAAALVSGLLVARRLRQLDLIAVLKTRE